MIARSVGVNSVLLGLFALVATAVIASTFLGTREQIAENVRAAEAAALLEIVPRESHDNDMLDTAVALTNEELLKLRGPRPAFLATNNGDPVAVILPATARDGYSGDIQLIVGINSDGSVAGVRVLEHRETPGLGDKVELKKDDWIRDFEGRSLVNPVPAKWRVKKDGGVFDSFTGATITPRAVVAAVKRALEFYAANQVELTQRPATPTAQGEGT